MAPYAHADDPEFVAALRLRRYAPVAAVIALIGAVVSFSVTQTIAGNTMAVDYAKVPLGAIAVLMCLVAASWLRRAWLDEGFLHHRYRIVAWIVVAALVGSWDLLAGFGVV